ncbi:diacylglycerol/lipid kinase family protein [Agrilactobacillus yilanensis]|uniref:Diacylglycerol/lipid kinase family protein n=1 Tax=Agrilactobacillus yilanensis TaxID=2485997 RepID=A0ABW4J682_9LACO|nr:YegS/Rv2252/BmrU family lipid kinase [Agrilactobacillus yilanensis]
MKPYFFHIIANEIAGAYHGKTNTKLVVQYLTQQQIQFTLNKTHYPGHAVKIAQALIIPKQDQYQHLVLVIGGDGTLHQVIKGLRQNTQSPLIPVGYIPSGSGNDFSRSLNLSADPIKNLQQIQQAKAPQNLDIGVFTQTNGHTSIFVNNIGIGIDARTVFLTNHSKIKKVLNHLKLGTFSYLANLLRAYRQQKSFSVTVKTKDQKQTFKNIFLVTFGNEPYFGGGVPILPHANVYSRSIELVLVEKLPFHQLAPLFYRVFKDGTHLKDKHVHYFKGRQFQLTTNQLEYGQIDGEELGHHAFDFKVTLTQYPFWLK